MDNVYFGKAFPSHFDSSINAYISFFPTSSFSLYFLPSFPLIHRTTLTDKVRDKNKTDSPQTLIRLFVNWFIWGDSTLLFLLFAFFFVVVVVAAAAAVLFCSFTCCFPSNHLLPWVPIFLIPKTNTKKLPQSKDTTGNKSKRWFKQIICLLYSFFFFVFLWVTTVEILTSLSLWRIAGTSCWSTCRGQTLAQWKSLTPRAGLGLSGDEGGGVVGGGAKTFCP